MTNPRFLTPTGGNRNDLVQALARTLVSQVQPEQPTKVVQSQNKRVYALLVAYASSHLYPQVT